MIKANIIVIFIFASLTLMPVNAQVKGNLWGRVVDLLGTPIVGAEVQLQVSGSKEIEKVSTNADGFYSFKTVPDGKFVVTATLSGFVKSKVESSYYVEGGQGLKSIDFGLEVGRLDDFLAGTVEGSVSVGGKSIKDAKIKLVNAFNYDVVETGVSDGNGRFSIAVRQPGAYIVYTVGPGLPICTKGVLIKPGRENKPLKIELACS